MKTSKKDTTTATVANCEAWEAAFGKYIEALANLDSLRVTRYERGQKRAFSNAKTVCKRARLAMRKLDPEFCDQMGW